MKFSGLILYFSFFFVVSLQAQKRKSLNYYSPETLTNIQATEEQRIKIFKVRQRLDSSLSVLRNDNLLSELDKKEKSKTIYAIATADYNAIISGNQKDILRSLRNEIEKVNVANGFAPIIDSSYRSKHYEMRLEVFKKFPIAKNSTVFLGNSITERGKWDELLPRQVIANRGIGGDNTYGVLARLDEIIEAKPEKVFLMIGINDIASRGWPVELVFDNYKKIIKRFQKESPNTTLFIQSTLPINEDLINISRFKGKSESIIKYNQKLHGLAMENNIEYIDLFHLFQDSAGSLKKEFTDDGIHLTPLAYQFWVSKISDLF